MFQIPRMIQIIIISVISACLFILVCVNLFKTEYDDPPYNYLSRNWLNSPIKDIEILNEPENTDINEYDNQENIGYFKSGKTKKDLNVFLDKYFKIKLYTPYYYPNFVGFFHKKDKNKLCGKDSQGNLMYFPKDLDCPINEIYIEDDNNKCTTSPTKYKCQQLDSSHYLVTSNSNTNGEIITQLRINKNNEILADSSVDLTFNDLLDDYENIKFEEKNGYDKIYHKLGEEDKVSDFLNENNLKNIKVKKDEKIFLSYRSYLGVNDFNNFEEHPIDHVTYAKKIALSKNIILFISCFFYAFCSIFILYFSDISNFNVKYICPIKIIFIIYCIFFGFNFFYEFHVIYTFARVKGIVKTVNLDGIEQYKSGLRWFIITDIIILFFVFFDFILKLFQFLMFRQLYSKDETKAIQMNSQE